MGIRTRFQTCFCGGALQGLKHNLSILRTGKARAVRVDTLNKLCRALDCQPGDLLEYRPGPEDDNVLE